MVVGGVLQLIQSAAAALQRREPAAARKALRQAQALDPADPASWSDLGFAHLQRHRAEAAVAAFAHPRSLDPALAEAAVGQGGALMVMERFREGGGAL